MEFWRYYRIIRRRRWLILLGMMICVGAVAYSNMRSVQEYVGTTTLQEFRGASKEGVLLYPEQLMQMDVQLQLSNLANTASSIRVRQATLDALKDFSSIQRSDPEIYDILMNRITVRPEKDTSIIAIEVRLPTNQQPYESREDAEKRTEYESATVAEIYASEFKKVYAELNNSAVTQSREFIEEQIKTTRQSMSDAQNKLRAFKETNGIVEIDRQTSAVVQRLEQAKNNHAQAEASRLAAIARARKQAEESAGLAEWEKVSETTAVNPVWQRLNQQLIDLESEKASQMGHGRGAKHPSIIALQAQIEAVKKEFAAVAESEYIKSSTTESKNNVQQNSLDRLIAAKVEETASAAQAQVYARELDVVRNEMALLPMQAAKYAELLTDVQAATQTYGNMRLKLDEAKIKEEQIRNAVALKTIDRPYSRPAPNKQRVRLVLALLLSPILGIGVAFLLYYTDNTVKTATEAEKLLGLPVLCAIPETRAHCFAKHKNHPEFMDVAYQMLTSSLWVASQQHELNGLVVVSAEPNTGRSITASNLGIALASEGARVVIVDADLRQPTLHRIFGADNKVGLTNVIAGAASLEDALVPTRFQGLLLVPTGPIPDNAVKLLRSEMMKSVDEQIKEVADFVIYDTPAGVTFPDAVLVAAHVGAAVVVHSAGRVPRGSEADLNARLDSVGVSVLGAVLNKVKRDDSSGYFHYHRSYQGIGAGQLPDARQKTALNK